MSTTNTNNIDSRSSSSSPNLLPERAVSPHKTQRPAELNPVQEGFTKPPPAPPQITTSSPPRLIDDDVVYPSPVTSDSDPSSPSGSPNRQSLSISGNMTTTRRRPSATGRVISLQSNARSSIEENDLSNIDRTSASQRNSGSGGTATPQPVRIPSDRSLNASSGSTPNTTPKNEQNTAVTIDVPPTDVLSDEDTLGTLGDDAFDIVPRVAFFPWLEKFRHHLVEEHYAKFQYEEFQENRVTSVLIVLALIHTFFVGTGLIVGVYGIVSLRPLFILFNYVCIGVLLGILRYVRTTQNMKKYHPHLIFDAFIVLLLAGALVFACIYSTTIDEASEDNKVLGVKLWQTTFAMFSLTQLIAPRNVISVGIGIMYIVTAVIWIPLSSSEQDSGLKALFFFIELYQVIVLCIFINDLEFFTRQRFLQRRETELAGDMLLEQRNVTTSLLRNIIPSSIVDRLNSGELKPGKVFERYDTCGVLFADIVQFTKWSTTQDPRRVGTILHRLMSLLDDRCLEFGCEKVKTVGDAYWVMTGVPDKISNLELIMRICEFALSIPTTTSRVNQTYSTAIIHRIGVHVGPVFAGIMGKTRFSYDVWGATMDRCVELEAGGVGNRVHCSHEFRVLLESIIECRDTFGCIDSTLGTVDNPTYFIEDQRLRSETGSARSSTCSPSPSSRGGEERTASFSGASPRGLRSSSKKVLTSSHAGRKRNKSGGASSGPQPNSEGEESTKPVNNITTVDIRSTTNHNNSLLGNAGAVNNNRNSVKYALGEHEADDEAFDSSLLNVDPDTPVLSSNSNAQSGATFSDHDDDDTGGDTTDTERDHDDTAGDDALLEDMHLQQSSDDSSDRKTYAGNGVSLRQLRKIAESPDRHVIDSLKMKFKCPYEETVFRKLRLMPQRRAVFSVWVGCAISINICFVWFYFNYDHDIKGMFAPTIVLTLVHIILAFSQQFAIPKLPPKSNLRHPLTLAIVSCNAFLPVLLLTVGAITDDDSRKLDDHNQIRTALFAFVMIPIIMLGRCVRCVYIAPICLIIGVAHATLFKKLHDEQRVYEGAFTFTALWAIVMMERVERTVFSHGMKVKLEDLEVEIERQKSEALLHAVMPRSVYNTLRANNSTLFFERKPEATVLFLEVLGFNELLARYEKDSTDSDSAMHLNTTLSQLFTRFDQLCTKHRVEKIKSIGNVYLAVVGAPDSRKDHAKVAVNITRMMLKDAVSVIKKIPQLQLRAGINSGPLVGGVLGRSRLAYDIFGDTVNTASRMMTASLPNCIQISSTTKALLPEAFSEKHDWLERVVELKGKGSAQAFMLENVARTSRRNKQHHKGHQKKDEDMTTVEEL